MDALLRASIQRMDAGQGKGPTGIPTPIYRKLSDALFGWRGLIVIAAAPGVGKTTLALTAALDAVQHSQDACMLFVSFEMGTNVLCDRMISQMSGISQRVLRSGPMDEKKIEERDEARKRLSSLGHRVTIVGRDDVGKLTGDASSCLSNIAQIVEQMKAQSGATRSFVVIDHLGVVPVELPEKRPWPNDTERVRHVMSGLVSLRDRLGDDNPVVLIAQARKNDWSSAELASVMGTADTAYTADAVIVISRSNDEEDNQEVANNRTKQKLLASIVKGRDMMRYAEIFMTFDITTSTLVEDDAR
jgi:replicative DNA helicase